MEAPVPASALIHSATLVSAGVYLLLKFFNIFLFLNYTFLITVVGALTCAYGGIISASQTDMKKLLAYSTMSHCGFLYITISFGYFFLTIIYLFLHGIFKAATFYCVGSFVRVYKTQDIRLMGAGHIILPVDSILLLICAVNLGGLPFTIGYIYKSFFFNILLVQAIPS
jgi:NADH:ubiquinone oxidoreductase subunit 5 (subunit L)/multisubunit Na+/H+ antiporter MnhA subunit